MASSEEDEMIEDELEADEEEEAAIDAAEIERQEEEDDDVVPPSERVDDVDVVGADLPPIPEAAEQEGNRIPNFNALFPGISGVQMGSSGVSFGDLMMTLFSGVRDMESDIKETMTDNPPSDSAAESAAKERFEGVLARRRAAQKEAEDEEGKADTNRELEENGEEEDGEEEEEDGEEVDGKAEREYPSMFPEDDKLEALSAIIGSGDKVKLEKWKQQQRDKLEKEMDKEIAFFSNPKIQQGMSNMMAQMAALLERGRAPPTAPPSGDVDGVDD